MALLKKEELVTVKDYLEGELVSETKHEYLGGEIHAMAGGKVRHHRAAGNVFGQLFSALQGKTCRPFNSDMKVRVDLPAQTRFYYPDASVICDGIDDEDTYSGQPVVVVEVLSESTRRIDLGEKRDAYLAIPSLQVLLMVDPAKPWVQLDRRTEIGGFVQERYDDLEEVIGLPEIGCDLKVREIYDGIEFAP